MPKNTVEVANGLMADGHARVRPDLRELVMSRPAMFGLLDVPVL